MAIVEIIAQPEGDHVKGGVNKFKRPMPPVFDTLEEERKFKLGQLAGAFRIFCTQGWENSNAQLSIRDPIQTDTIWTNPSGYPTSHMSVSKLIQVDLQGKIVSGPKDAVYDIDSVSLHLAIYEARPEVGSIVHAHTMNARTFSMQGRTIDMICQDSCTFYNKVHVLPLKAVNQVRSNRKPVQDTIKDGKALILQHKGALTVGAAIECSLSYFIRFENLCKVQLLAEAACRGRGGKTIKVGEEEVAFTFQNTGSEHHAYIMSLPYYQRLEKRGDGSHLL